MAAWRRQSACCRLMTCKSPVHERQNFLSVINRPISEQPGVGARRKRLSLILAVRL